MTAPSAGRCLVVAGMHRSGTSLVTQVLSRAGLYLGPDLLGPGAHNPDGLFEDRDIVGFHDALLAHSGVAWDTVKGREPLALPGHARAAALELLARKFDGRPTWGWKDPRTTLFLDFWRELLPAGKWLLVVRDPAQVAWSLLRRGMHRRPAGHGKHRLGLAWSGLQLWTAYNRRLLAFGRRHRQDAFVLLVPDDLDQVGRTRLDATLDRWSLGLEPVTVDGVWVPSLFRTGAPPWLAALARGHAPSRVLWRRLLRLRRDLASRASSPGRPAPMPSRPAAGERPVVCVVRPERSAYSQTFVEAHVRRLPATVKVLHSGYFPQFTQDDRPLLSLGERGLAVLGEALGRSRRPLERRALSRWLRRHRVEVVLAEFGQTGAEIWEACQAARVPLVVHFHGGDAVRQKWWRIYGAAYRQMFSVASCIIAVSRQTETALVALGVPRDRLLYNPYGVDTTLFTPADPSAAPPHFLAVNRFVDKKAPHLTILAFAQVFAACPDARLLMVGDGPLLEASRQLTRALALDGAVDFLGPVSNAEVAAAMARVRALVLHSVTTSDGDVEGTPVCVIEAGAAGLPVVATRHGGISDVVLDGETGLLVEERDVDGMARALLALARDPARAAALGRRARERVVAHFSIEACIARLWDALDAARRR